jgi:hypothetical protein
MALQGPFKGPFKDLSRPLRPWPYEALALAYEGPPPMRPWPWPYEAYEAYEALAL